MGREPVLLNVLSVFALVLSATLNPTPTIAQYESALMEVRPTDRIPKEYYKTWSLFLVCNPQWLASEKQGELYDLFDTFRNFGQTIGDANVAVWFWKHGGTEEAAIGKNVDVRRNIKFCKAFGLRPSRGPHLVVMATYPDESHLPTGLPPNSAVFEFGKMRPAAIHELLAHIVDDLIEERHVSKPAGAPPNYADVEEELQPAFKTEQPMTRFARLLEAVQKTMKTFGCAWSFKVDAGPVKTGIQPCGKG